MEGTENQHSRLAGGTNQLMTKDCQTWLVLLRDAMRSNDIGYVLTSMCNERDWSEVLASIVDRKAWELDGVSNTASQRLQ